MDKGLPLYHVERIIQETKERFEDGSHIIYVNGSYKNDDDPVGKLMHDFRCTSSIDMFYDELKNTVKYFKETEGERRLRPLYPFLIRNGILQSFSICTKIINNGFCNDQ